MKKLDIEKQFAEHEKMDIARFAEISESLRDVARLKDIEDAVRSAVQTTVNGKLDNIKGHLERQDTAMEEMSDKIKPLDTTRTYLGTTIKVIIYMGTICLAIVGIMKLLSKFI